MQVNTGIFSGSIAFFSKLFWEIEVLDTLDQFDYDSACTMILNLEWRASVAVANGYRRALIWFATDPIWFLKCHFVLTTTYLCCWCSLSPADLPRSTFLFRNSLDSESGPGRSWCLMSVARIQLGVPASAFPWSSTLSRWYLSCSILKSSSWCPGQWSSDRCPAQPSGLGIWSISRCWFS